MGMVEVYMKEQAAALTNFGAYGQVWVKDDVPNTLWFTNDVGTDTQLDTGGGVAAKPGQFRSGTGVNITTTEATMDLNSEIFDPDTNYSLATDVITVTDAGYYLISYQLAISIDGTGGATNGTTTARMTLNGTTTEMVGSQAQTYVTENNTRDFGISNTFMYNLAASDTIQLRCVCSSTTDQSQTNSETYVNIMKIR